MLRLPKQISPKTLKIGTLSYQRTRNISLTIRLTSVQSSNVRGLAICHGVAIEHSRNFPSQPKHTTQLFEAQPKEEKSLPNIAKRENTNRAASYKKKFQNSQSIAKENCRVIFHESPFPPLSNFIIAALCPPITQDLLHDLKD